MLIQAVNHIYYRNRTEKPSETDSSNTPEVGLRGMADRLER